MAEYIAFHPAVTVAVQILRTEMPDVGSASEFPRADPDVFVRVDRVGGVRANLVTDAPLMLFECWAKTEPAAEQLAMDVSSVMAASQFRTYQGAQVRWWRLAGLAHLDDPDKPGWSRWQVTGELALSQIR